MAEATASVRGVMQEQSSKMSNSMNSTVVNQFIDPNLMRKPDGFVYIYSVSGRDFTVSLPPHIPGLHLQACPATEEYVLVATIPQPFQQPDVDILHGDHIARAHDARKIAQDICNPSNTSLNQDATLDARTVLGYGNDLTRQGVFWSENKPPKPEEIAKAKSRRETYFRALLERARTLEVSNPRELENEINHDYHIAADYFGMTTSWHKQLLKPAECPNCGDSIKAGVAFHKNSDGITCVIDWKRAVSAGVKTREDVPEELRWWGEVKKPFAKTGA